MTTRSEDDVRTEEPEAGTAATTSRAWPVLAGVLSVLAVGLHAWMASAASIPVLWTDELGYLANAQVIAGVGEPLDLAGRGYYIGWSLVIAPLWWVLDQPETVYRVAVWVSAVTGVALIGVIAMIARRLGVTWSQGLAVGAVVSLAPSRALMSNFALAEHLLTLLVALAVLAALRFRERSDVVGAVALALATAALFVTHGRTVPVVLATTAWFAWTALRGSRPAGLVGSAVLWGLSAAGFVVYRDIVSLMYSGSQDREASGIERIVEGDPTAIAVSGLGQVWYETVVWGGLALLGALALLAAAASELRRRDPGPAVWSVISLLGLFVISATWVSRVISVGRDRLDVYAYGRYLEPYGALLAALGLVLVIRGLTVRLRVTLVVVTAVVMGLFFYVNDARTPLGGALFWGPTSVPGLLAWDWPGVTAALRPPWVAAAVAAAVGVLLIVALRRFPLVVVVLFAAFFTWGSVTAQTKTVTPYFSGFRESFGLREALAEYPDATISFDTWRGSGEGVPRDPVSRNAYQYWGFPRPVEVVRTPEAAPTGELVIARDDWPWGEARGAVKVARDTGLFDNALWVMPGELQDSLPGS